MKDINIGFGIKLKKCKKRIHKGYVIDDYEIVNKLRRMKGGKNI